MFRWSHGALSGAYECNRMVLFGKVVLACAFQCNCQVGRESFLFLSLSAIATLFSSTYGCDLVARCVEYVGQDLSHRGIYIYIYIYI